MAKRLDWFRERFPSQEDSLAHLAKLRWQGKPTCPYCGSNRISQMRGQSRLHCNQCNCSFGATTRTLFHRNRIPLYKCFFAAWQIIEGNRNITGRMLGQEIQVSKDAGCKLMTKIAIGLHDSTQRDLIHRLVESFLLDTIQNKRHKS